MGNIRHSNNASALLASGITDTATSLTVGAGEGALFPTVGAGAYAKVALEDASGNLEIVHLTARAGDVLTVTRAQEGTAGFAFSSGARVENRVTAAALNEFLQSSGDTFAGILDGQSVGQISNTRINGGELVNTPVRGDTGVTTNQFVVPSGGGSPTIGGSVVYTTANLSAATILSQLLTVDGPGSALDADLLDGLNGAAYAQIAGSQTISGSWTISGAHNFTTTPTINGLAVGYREVPQNSQSGNYTAVLSDNGKHLLHPTGAGAGDTFTIPSNASVAYPVGTALVFVNRDSNPVSIGITTDTLVLTGTTTTGTRTLAQNGVATALKVEATVWLIDGKGLT